MLFGFSPPAVYSQGESVKPKIILALESDYVVKGEDNNYIISVDTRGLVNTNGSPVQGIATVTWKTNIDDNFNYIRGGLPSNSKDYFIGFEMLENFVGSAIAFERALSGGKLVAPTEQGFIGPNPNNPGTGEMGFLTFRVEQAGTYTLPLTITDVGIDSNNFLRSYNSDEGNVIINVPNTIIVYDSHFDAFKAQLPAGQNGNYDDPDNDELYNLQEFAFGTNPLVKNGLADITLLNYDNGFLKYDYQARVDDPNVTTYAVYSGNDLENFSRNGVTETILSTNGNIEKRQANVLIDQEKSGYFKLVVEIIP